MNNSDSQKSHTGIRAAIFSLLDKYPSLKPLELCKLAGLDYAKYRDYVAHLRTAWKYDTKNEHGLKCSIHAWRGWTRTPGPVDRAGAVAAGWKETRARNRWLLWRDPLGRLQLFETGRINIYVRKPATKGKAAQLLAKAFTWTNLITDFRALETMINGIRFKGAHYVFDVGQPMPKLTIDLFGPSSGIVIKLGDRSDPTSLEVLAHYPDWAERNERLFQDMHSFLESLMGSKEPGPPKIPYWR